MDNQILDTAPNEKLRKPVRWWVAGLLGGVVCALIDLTHHLYIIPRLDPTVVEHILYRLLAATLLYSPFLIAAIVIALWGKRTWHFLRILGSLTLSITLHGCILMLVVSSVNADSFQRYGEHIKHYLPFVYDFYINIYFWSVIGAFLLWLFPGRWKKYRNQVMRD